MLLVFDDIKCQVESAMQMNDGSSIDTEIVDFSLKLLVKLAIIVVSVKSVRKICKNS